MSKAFYRKYRSKSFDEVVGQEHVTTTLKNAIAKGKISHAYLFTGPRGVGKTSIARILAHAVNGLEYSKESTPIDIIEIDAASNRRIDEIRELRDKVHIAPTSAKYKVYIIDEVHMLTKEAFNALLKTLEEPPAHVIFILATTEAHKVPDTIISRTQRFSFKPIDTENAIRHLKAIADKENLEITDEALQLIATYGEGSFRDSISMLDQLAGMDSQRIDDESVRQLLGVPSEKLVNEAIEACASSDTERLFTSIKNLREAGIDATRAAKSISMRLRDDLAQGSTQLSHSKTIKLLRNLLPLTATATDYLSLELALLEHFDYEESVSQSEEQAQEVKKTKAASAEKEAITPSSKKKDEHSTAVSEKVSEERTTEKTLTANEPRLNQKASENTTLQSTKQFDNESWGELLHEVKKKHTTLYGVLRMAQPELKDEVLHIGFGFGFHKKQIDSPRHSATLREYVQRFFGPLEYVTHIVEENQVLPTARETTRNEEPDNDAIANVSNIFGGAELLES